MSSETTYEKKRRLRIYRHQQVETLYVGVTNELRRRMWEHKQKIGSKFTTKYNVTRLAYFETFDDIRDAIVREKQLERWRREKKVWLIERDNSEWRDLAAGWYDEDVTTTETSERCD